MQIATARKLIELNKTFYSEIGSEFDARRDFLFRPGWEKIEFSANSYQSRSILDIGCGNGLFYTYLSKKLPSESFTYIGVDSSEVLLEKAKQRIFDSEKEVSFVNLYQDQGILDIVENSRVLILSDLFDEWEEVVGERKFGTLVLFNVLHHIPGRELRIGLMQKLAKFMTIDSRLIFTLWRFRDVPRLAKRIIQQGNPEFQSVLERFNIPATELEQGDHVLDWNEGKKAYRYCHYSSEEEIQDILTSCNFKITNRYQADGKEGQGNEYLEVGIIEGFR